MMFTLEKKYHDWRTEVKKNYFLKYENDEDRLCNTPPPRIPPKDWAHLVANYNPDEHKEMMLAPPVGVCVEQRDGVEVEQDIQEPMEEGDCLDEVRSCTSVNGDEIARKEELHRMEKEFTRQLEEMRAQNARLEQKLEEVKSQYDSVSAATQRLVPGSTQASIDADENMPQGRVSSRKGRTKKLLMKESNGCASRSQASS